MSTETNKEIAREAKIQIRDYIWKQDQLGKGRVFYDESEFERIILAALNKATEHRMARLNDLRRKYTHGEQLPEWTHEIDSTEDDGIEIHCLYSGGVGIGLATRPNATAICERHNAELTNEYQRNQNQADVLKRLGDMLGVNLEQNPTSALFKALRTEREQLLSAQAAIESINKMHGNDSLPMMIEVKRICRTVKLDLLLQHDEEVRRPLVAALEKIREVAYDALAKTIEFYMETPTTLEQKPAKDRQP